jgi:hypothetical protein
MARTLFDFSSPETVAEWSAIDDRVMGGISRSRMRHDPAGHAVFEGVVSLEQNGGFASVRSRAGPLGAPGAVAYLLDVAGDGKRYKLSLRLDDGFDGVTYQADFAPAAAAWTIVRLPVAAFRATFRGRTVTDAPLLDLARVRQAGLLISDRQTGPFELAIRAIRVE